MINQFDVYYDTRENKAYYAAIVTPEVSVLRPIKLPQLSDGVSGWHCGVTWNSGPNLSDCKTVTTDLSKLIPVNDLGEPMYGSAPYIKIGILQGDRCKSLFEEPMGMRRARQIYAEYLQKLKKEEINEQKAFDEEFSKKKDSEDANMVKAPTVKRQSTSKNKPAAKKQPAKSKTAIKKK